MTTYTDRILDMIASDPNRSGVSIATELGCDASVAQKVIKRFRKGAEKVLKANKEQKSKDPVDADDSVEFLKIVGKEPEVNIYDFADRLSVPPRRIRDLVDFHHSKGLEVAIFDDTRVMLCKDVPTARSGPEKPLADREIVFAIASDLHFGSKHVQITHLHAFCEEARKAGVTDIICPGDVMAGYNVYPGQRFEQYAITADAQEQSVLANLPTGFRWWMIGGNHDYTFVSKGGGHNPMLVLANQREDINYIGFDQATLPILNGVDMILWHPAGGVPYSISYRMQKGAEQIAYSELNKIAEGVKDKPTVRFAIAGHLHIHIQMFVGPIWACQAGCFEGQTNYLKKKGLVPTIGGWIVKASLGRNGQLNRIEAPFIRYNDEIIDDYKNYEHELTNEYRVDKPIFSA